MNGVSARKRVLAIGVRVICLGHFCAALGICQQNTKVIGYL